MATPLTDISILRQRALAYGERAQGERRGR